MPGEWRESVAGETPEAKFKGLRDRMVSLYPDSLKADSTAAEMLAVWREAVRHAPRRSDEEQHLDPAEERFLDQVASSGFTGFENRAEADARRLTELRVAMKEIYADLPPNATPGEMLAVWREAVSHASRRSDEEQHLSKDDEIFLQEQEQIRLGKAA